MGTLDSDRKQNRSQNNNSCNGDILREVCKVASTPDGRVMLRNVAGASTQGVLQGVMAATVSGMRPLARQVMDPSKLGLTQIYQQKWACASFSAAVLFYYAATFSSLVV